MPFYVVSTETGRDGVPVREARRYSRGGTGSTVDGRVDLTEVGTRVGTEVGARVGARVGI